MAITESLLALDLRGVDRDESENLAIPLDGISGLGIHLLRNRKDGRDDAAAAINGCSISCSRDSPRSLFTGSQRHFNFPDSATGDSFGEFSRGQ